MDGGGDYTSGGGGGGPIVRSTTRKQERDYSNYEDAVAVVDCRPFWRKLGVVSVNRYPRQMWFVKDCCGVVCAVFTWGLVLYAEFVVLYVMLLPAQNQLHSLVNGVIFQILAFLAIASHARAMLTDPGAVPRGNATQENIKKLGLKDGQVVFKCPKCVSIKPERAHHCSVCRRCIKKMDHHCPWVNNCIGENNQKFFVLFTMYICLISCHALYMAIHHFVVCIRNDWKDRLREEFGGMLHKPHNQTQLTMEIFLKEECTVFSPAATTIFMIFLLFEALLFGIFTAIMCGTQMSAICSDETAIEQLKKEENPNWEKKSMWLSIKAVFGHPFSYKWFSPFHTTNSGKDKLYLYNV